MDIREMLNNPGEEPRRRPRPSISTPNSESPVAENRRQSSLQASTPISPPGPSSAHGSMSQSYFDRPQPTFPSTPSSSHTRNPMVATPRSFQSQTPIDTHTPNPPVPQPPPSASYHSPHRDPALWKREQSLSVSPKTVVSNLPSHPAPPRFDQRQYTPQRQKFEDVVMANHSTTGEQSPARASSSDAHQRQSASAASGNSSKRPYADDGESMSPSTEAVPAPKRRRVVEIPIWARPAKKLRPLPKYTTNGAAPPPAAQAEVAPQTQPDFGSDGPLGPFEESFRGDFIPQEELTRQICDFLFHHVVLNDSAGTGKVGETAKVDGQLEIEAKIGTIIDKKTDERLALPIASEAIVRAGFDVAFESMMTEQHQSFNELLNESLKASRGPPVTDRRGKRPRPRIPMNYEHRYEIDTFYELPGDEISNLPQSLQSLLRAHPSHKPKLRVTTHKKTGEILAKIVKARISDIHVTSPLTRFDWRVSVSLEAKWDGNLDALIQASGDAAGNGRKAQPDRHKDRLSYSHLFCQIDLTQVKSQGKKAMDTTHELEVELDSTAVKEQGQLVKQGLDNQYQDLVKAFVDNVRILVRGVQ